MKTAIVVRLTKTSQNLFPHTSKSSSSAIGASGSVFICSRMASLGSARRSDMAMRLDVDEMMVDDKEDLKFYFELSPPFTDDRLVSPRVFPHCASD
jgi:hypothetical protein